MNLLDRITTHPERMAGKPTIRGYRLTAEHMNAAINAGLTFEELKEDFPFLEPEDLDAVRKWAKQKQGR